MFDLNKLIVEAYEEEKSKDFSFDRLVEMVEAVMAMQESLGIIKEENLTAAVPKNITITYDGIPDIPVSELGWGSASGDPEQVNVRREQLESFLAPIKDTYLNLNEILIKLERFFPRDISIEAAEDVLPAFAQPTKDQIQDAMSFLIFYKALTEIMRNFNESAAGFSFESFLAVLFGGEQVPTGTGTIADLYDSQGTPISLKLLREGTAMVGGSYSDLVRDLIKNVNDPDYKMHYLVCLKDIRGEGLSATGAIRFYRYYFNSQNFMQIMNQSKPTQEYLKLPKIKVGPRTKPVFFKTIGGTTKLVSGTQYRGAKAAGVSLRAAANKLEEAKPVSFNLGDLEPKYQQVVDQNRGDIMAALDPENNKQGYLDAIKNMTGRGKGTLLGKAVEALKVLDPSKKGVSEQDFLTQVLNQPVASPAIQTYLDQGYYSKDKPKITRDGDQITMKPARVDKRLQQQISALVRQGLANYLGLQGKFTRLEDWEKYINGLNVNQKAKSALIKSVSYFTNAVFKGIEQRVFDVISDKYAEASKGLDIKSPTKVSGFASTAQSNKILSELQQKDPAAFVQTLRLTQGYIKTKNWEFSPEQIMKGMNAAGTQPLEGDQSDGFSGVVYIGVPNVLAFANAIKAQLDARIFEVFQDLRDMTNALESFYNSGLKDTPAAQTASEEADQIKTNVDAMASEEAQQEQADVQNNPDFDYSE